MMKIRISQIMRKVLCISLLLGAFVPMLGAAPDSFAPIVKSEKGKVVHIATTTTIKNTRPPQWEPFFEKYFPNFPKERKSNALGSGFFISSDGYIATNNHVIENADEIQVILIDGKTYDAKVVGTDPKTDLALIKVEGKNFPVVTMGDSSSLEIGDWVIAIGNPLGLDFTVTAGILSARERSLFSDTAYGQFLQTDAAINPGNSGGPLFDSKGEVIGINTAIVASGQGLGFAIPINLAKDIINQLKDKGKVERGWLGVGIQDVTPEMTENLSLPPNTKGVAVTSVGPDTPAEKSGVKEGDVFIEFNGKTVEKTGNLQQAVAETRPNTTVKAKVYRDGKITNLTITVGLAPKNTAQDDVGGGQILGMNLRFMSEDEAKKQGFKFSGLVVLGVDEQSEAAEKGIEKGMIIRQINRKPIKSMQYFIDFLRKNESENVLLLVSQPDGGSRFVSLSTK